MCLCVCVCVWIHMCAHDIVQAYAAYMRKWRVAHLHVLAKRCVASAVVHTPIATAMPRTYYVKVCTAEGASSARCAGCSRCMQCAVRSSPPPRGRMALYPYARIHIQTSSHTYTHMLTSHTRSHSHTISHSGAAAVHVVTCIHGAC